MISTILQPIIEHQIAAPSTYQVGYPDFGLPGASAGSRVASISIPKALYSEEVVAGYQQQQPRGSESEIGVMKRKPRYCWAYAAEMPLQGIPRTVEAFWTLEIWIIYFLVD